MARDVRHATRSVGGAGMTHGLATNPHEVSEYAATAQSVNPSEHKTTDAAHSMPGCAVRLQAKPELSRAISGSTKPDRDAVLDGGRGKE